MWGKSLYNDPPGFAASSAGDARDRASDRLHGLGPTPGDWRSGLRRLPAQAETLLQRDVILEQLGLARDHVLLR